MFFKSFQNRVEELRENDEETQSFEERVGEVGLYDRLDDPSVSLLIRLTQRLDLSVDMQNWLAFGSSSPPESTPRTKRISPERIARQCKWLRALWVRRLAQFHRCRRD